MSSRRALGKGLDAIFAGLGTEVANPNTGTAVHEVELARVSPNPFQPRREFAEQELAELSDSISRSGLLQPILLRKHGNGYQIISGERRFRATQRLGRTHIQALVRDQVSDRDMRELAIIENVQRVQLNALEEALAYEELVNACGMTHEEIAARVGKSRAAVSNTLRLLKLEPQVREWLREGRLTAGHGRALLQFQGAEQVRRAQAALEESLNVREAEQGARAARAAQGTAPAKTPDADTRAVLDELRALSGMKVGLKGGARKGVLEFHFVNRDDVNNLIELLRRGSQG